MQRAGSLRGSRQRLIPFLLTAALVLAADQLSKLWIRSHLLLSQSRPGEGWLRLTYVNNSGGIFGLAAPNFLWLVLSTLAMIAALFLYHRYLSCHQLTMKVAAAMLCSGGISNLADRLSTGHVTDFIDLQLGNSFHWPTFNLADCAIVAGVALLGYFLFFQRNQPQPG